MVTPSCMFAQFVYAKGLPKNALAAPLVGPLMSPFSRSLSLSLLQYISSPPPLIYHSAKGGLPSPAVSLQKMSRAEKSLFASLPEYANILRRAEKKFMEIDPARPARGRHAEKNGPRPRTGDKV